MTDRLTNTVDETIRRGLPDLLHNVRELRALEVAMLNGPHGAEYRRLFDEERMHAHADV